MNRFRFGRRIHYLIGVVGIAILRLPTSTCFLSHPLAPTVSVQRSVVLTLKAHSVSSLLPHNTRTKKKRRSEVVRQTNNNTQLQNVYNKEWKNHSIPKGMPSLTTALKGLTKEDFGARNDVGKASMKHSPSNEVLIQPVHRPKQEMVFDLNNKHNSAQGNVGELLQKTRQKHFRDKRIEQSRNSSLEVATAPWQASFRTSRQTQERIKQAGRSIGDKSKLRAISVLNALLDSPSTDCNEANVVCALTLSAKLCEPDRRNLEDEELRSLLFRTLDVLHQLVQNHRLNARQLCNAVWAIAKHYDRDQCLLPPPPQSAALSSDDKVGVAEAMSFIDDNDLHNQARQRIDDTIDEIARQLITILVEEEETKPSNQRCKVGEICMASWAYGILRPRRRPPGWQLPPQMGRLPNGASNGKQPTTRPSSFFTFEKWRTSELHDDYDDGGDAQAVPMDETDRLFDAIGESLCKPLESSAKALNGVEVAHRMRLENCSWNELANLAWAYASHGHCRPYSSESLLISLSREAIRRLNSSQGDSDPSGPFLTRDIAQIVWALGTLQCDNFRLADSLVDLIDSLVAFYGIHEVRENDSLAPLERPFQDWSCADLVQLAISLAHARIDSLPLLRVLFSEAHHRLLRGLDNTSANERHQAKRLRLFRDWEVSVLLWAQARLYLTSAQGKIFEDFAMEAPRALVKAMELVDAGLGRIRLGPQEQANVAWSLTVLQQHQSPEAVVVLSSIFREAARYSQKHKMIQLEHAHQLWQALFLMEEESPKAVQDVPTWFRQYLKEKWLVEKSREKRSSARHRALSQTLHFMGVSHLNEHDEDIDVAIVLKPGASWTCQARPLVAAGSRRFGGFREEVAPVRVAVEFDGPNHFAREPTRRNGEGISTKSPPPRALGHTVLKYRLLKKQGWTVVRVPYYEFDKIPFWASMERQRYLQRLLKTHANIRFSDFDVSQYKALVPSRESRFD